jgi:hypothetical protein
LTRDFPCVRHCAPEVFGDEEKAADDHLVSVL